MARRHGRQGQGGGQSQTQRQGQAQRQQMARQGQTQRQPQMARQGQTQRQPQMARQGQTQRQLQNTRQEQAQRQPQVARREQMQRQQRPPYQQVQQQQASKPQKPRRFYDYSLLFTIIFLTVFGLIMIYSSSSYTAQLKYSNASYFMMRQATIALGGFVLMLIISKINYHIYAKFAMFAYLLSYVFMIAVSIVGREVNGKKRWLGIGGASFQPTEFVKIALIVVLAVVITNMGKEINRWKSLFIIAGLTIPIALIVTANNLSSGIIIFGIAFVMSFVACKRVLPFAGLLGAGVGMLFAAPSIGHILTAVGILKEYQLSRINVWVQPELYPQDGGYQVLQGLYAIGSGGLVGKGLGESIQKLGFVPEAQNDMIFSIICEELGLFGAVSVILIFMFMIYRFMLIAGNAPDLLGAMLVTGVMGHIAIQVILNIAVVTNTIPNTGITLPFISYGGTSVLFLMMEMGIVLSVSNQIHLEK